MNKVKLNRREGVPRFNEAELVMLSVSGKIAPPLAKSPPYRIGQDGGLRVLPGTGGITIETRAGMKIVFNSQGIEITNGT